METSVLEFLFFAHIEECKEILNATKKESEGNQLLTGWTGLLKIKD